jgi:hypothetical protein
MRRREFIAGAVASPLAAQQAALPVVVSHSLEVTRA